MAWSGFFVQPAGRGSDLNQVLIPNERESNLCATHSGNRYDTPLLPQFLPRLTILSLWLYR